MSLLSRSARFPGSPSRRRRSASRSDSAPSPSSTPRARSYLSTDPAACANCHIMGEHFAAWQRSSHRAAAGCDDCHMPHDSSASTWPRRRTASGTPRVHHRAPSPTRSGSSRTTAPSPRAPAATATPTSSPRSIRSAKGTASRSGRRRASASDRPQIHDGTVASGDGILHPLPRVRRPHGALDARRTARDPDDPASPQHRSLDRPRRRRRGGGDRSAWPRCSPRSSSASRRRGTRSTAWSS